MKINPLHVNCKKLAAHCNSNLQFYFNEQEFALKLKLGPQHSWENIEHIDWQWKCGLCSRSSLTCFYGCFGSFRNLLILETVVIQPNHNLRCLWGTHLWQHFSHTDAGIFIHKSHVLNGISTRNLVRCGTVLYVFLTYISDQFPNTFYL